MKGKDKNIQEVLDADGNLMGKNSLGPENNRNNITASSKITDYNINVGRQQFDDDFLGRFGFHFYESNNTDEDSLLNKLAELEFEQYKNWVQYFVDNFSKENLKKWIKIANTDFDKLSNEDKKTDYYNAKKVISLLKKHIKDKKNKETITEDNNTKVDNDILPKVNQLTDLISTKEQGLDLLNKVLKSLKDKDLLSKDVNEILNYIKK